LRKVGVEKEARSKSLFGREVALHRAQIKRVLVGACAMAQARSTEECEKHGGHKNGASRHYFSLEMPARKCRRVDMMGVKR
jgi:hypothetical protein